VIDIPDAGEIKAKITIEYDPSGVEAAKKDLASLADIGGGAGDSLSSAGDELANFGDKAAKGAEGAQTFNAALSELPKMAESGTESIASMNDALSESPKAFEDTGTAAEETASKLQKVAQPMQVLTEHAQTMADRVSAAADNMSVFQNALDDPFPFQMINSHLSESGQSWNDFTSSIGNENTALLEGMGHTGMSAEGLLGQMSGSFQSAGKSISDSINWDTVGPPTDFAAEWSKVGDTLVQTGHAAEGAGSAIGKAGKASSAWWSGEAESVFGGGGVMGILNDLMMPMMAAQMIGMAVGAVGQGIYNAAVIAEGPGAHGIGTFTGAIDTMTASAGKAGQSFSENFGQGVLPALNAANSVAAQGKAGFDFWGNLGEGLGMQLGIVTDLAQVAGGAILSAFTVDGAGQGMLDAGSHGLANYWANWTGQAQPYPGPTPPDQMQIAYQQQMANMPRTVEGQTMTMKTQAGTLLADSVTPAYLQAQDELSASQAIYQRVQASYNASHPINQQRMLQEAQYQEYAAQQNALYQNYTGQGPGAGAAGQSSPLDFLTGMGPASVAGLQGQGGQTYGDMIGQGIKDFFGGTGFGGEVMQFLTGAGPANTAGGQTYGQAIGGGIGSFFGGMGAGIGGFFGGLGQDFNNLIGAGGATPPTTSMGCFPSGTLVLMADNSERAIESLEIGDRVKSHDGPTPVLALLKPPPRIVYELTFDDGNRLLLTASHPIATERGWKSLSPRLSRKENPALEVATLQVGDSVHTSDGTACKLLDIKARSVAQVYNITVAEPHTFYANKILVHNKMGAMASDGTGSENVSLSHTFTATVNWAATGLEKQFTAAAQWAEQNLVHTAVAAAQWAEQNLTHMAVAAAQWAEQNLTHSATAAAEWAEQNLIHPAIAAVQWAEQGLEHDAVAVANWAEQGLEHLFTGKASWIGQDLNHMFTAVAQWTAQNLTPSFTVNPSVTMLAEGTSNFPGGPAIVGEAGTEVVSHNGQYSLFDQGAALVNLPSGANVYPMQDLSYSPTAPVQFAEGTGGPVIPVSLGMSGRGASMPESVNVIVNLDSQTFLSAMGAPFAQTIRVGMGMRSF